jgi:hypothetical protein
VETAPKELFYQDNASILRCLKHSQIPLFKKEILFDLQCDYFTLDKPLFKPTRKSFTYVGAFSTMINIRSFSKIWGRPSALIWRYISLMSPILAWFGIHSVFLYCTIAQNEKANQINLETKLVPCRITCKTDPSQAGKWTICMFLTILCSYYYSKSISEL